MPMKSKQIPPMILIMLSIAFVGYFTGSLIDNLSEPKLIKSSYTIDSMIHSTNIYHESYINLLKTIVPTNGYDVSYCSIILRHQYDSKQIIDDPFAMEYWKVIQQREYDLLTQKIEEYC